MSARVLVAGIGNVFFRDDGFGVEVARRLAERSLPPGVRVADIGIRSLHLAYELLEPLDLLVVVDTASCGAIPGALVMLEPDLDGSPPTPSNAHAMDLRVVWQTLRALGGTPPPVLLLGCEPSDVSEGMGLTPAVARAVEPAIDRIRTLWGEEVSSC